MTLDNHPDIASCNLILSHKFNKSIEEYFHKKVVSGEVLGESI